MSDNITPSSPPNPVGRSFFTTKPFIALVVTAIVLCGGIALLKSLGEKTALSFGFSLDGKGLPPGKMPDVRVDGQPFASGNKISMGKHEIAVQLQDAEPLEQHFWVFYGAKNLGNLPLESSKGSLAVTVRPSPASVTIQFGGQAVRQGEAPLNVEGLPVGDYTLVIRRGAYEEDHPVKIQRQQRTDAKIDLSLGSIRVSATPADATFEMSDNNRQWKDKLPIKLDDVPAGHYTLIIHRNDYSETCAVDVVSQQSSETNITLNLGGVLLSSMPSNADYELLGNGRTWHGQLPAQIDNVPGGAYQFLARRDGWELTKNVEVLRAAISTNTIEFPYGSIQVTSDPTGLAISADGTELGKTPLTLRMKPGQYTLTATDGENDLTTNINVAPKEAARHGFLFHYGTVQLSSMPTGATVIRKGKEIGKTPLTITHIPAGETTLELRLPDYEATNLPIHAVEGTATSFSVKLISDHYLQAIKQARDAFGAAQFAEADRFLVAALESEPNDPTAMLLKTEVANAAARTEEARKEADRAAAIARKEAENQESVAVIEKAIQAAGGREVISRFRSFKAMSRTSGKKKNTDFSLRATTYVQFPDILRLDQEVENDPKKLGPLTITINQGRPARSTFCITRNGTWEVVPGILGSGFMQGPVSRAVQDELRASLYVAECKTLIPLLGSDYSLDKISDSPSAPFNTVTISVHKPGKPVVTMYFDKDKGLLVGLDTEKVDNSGHAIHDSERYSEYRSFSGFVLPTVTRYELDTGTSSTERMESFEPLGQYSGNVFTEPPRQ